MYKPVQTCNHCGANLTLDDMRGTQCPYCRTVYPHHSQAAQHAQVMGHMMNNMLAQQANIQNQWRGAFGVPPVGPPPMGQPGAPGFPPGIPSPYVDPSRVAHAHLEHASRLSRRIMLIVTLSIVFVFVLVGVIVAVTMLRF